MALERQGSGFGLSKREYCRRGRWDEGCHYREVGEQRVKDTCVRRVRSQRAVPCGAYGHSSEGLWRIWGSEMVTTKCRVGAAIRSVGSEGDRGGDGRGGMRT